MARGFKTGGNNFKKGQSGNPNGSASKNISNARRLNKTLVTELLNKFINMPTNELLNFVTHNVKGGGADPCIETLLATILVKAIQEGDHTRLNFIFDRLIGKVTDKVEHTLPVPTLIRRFDTDTTVMLGSKNIEEDENE